MPDNFTTADVQDGRPTLLTLLAAARTASDSAATDRALGALIERLYPLCERFLARRLASFRDGPDAAADAAQETMVRVAGALDECRANSDRELVGWVFVIARRTLVDLYRSPGSGFAARALAQELDDARDAAECVDADGAPPPMTATPRETLLALALQAYDALSSETAELLWWRLIQDAEWSEVAERMSTSAAGAKRRFQRAQNALRRAVGQLVATLPAERRSAVEGLARTYAQDSAPAPARRTPRALEDAA